MMPLLPVMVALAEQRLNRWTLLPVEQKALQITLLCPPESRVEAVLTHGVQINDRYTL